jgi:SNF2 family DNA or RNA helicase
MRRTALTDRNAESTDVASAFARIKAIREGASSQSAFLDSDSEASPTVPRRVASSLGTIDGKENAMSDGDEDSPAAPVRKKKNRLVRKSQLEVKESDEDEASPGPLARPRPRARAVLIDDSESETEDDSSADDAGGDDLANMMSGLGVSSGARAAASNPAAPPKPAPFAPIIPAAPRAPPREAPAPARAPATRAPAAAAPVRAAPSATTKPRAAPKKPSAPSTSAPLPKTPTRAPSSSSAAPAPSTPGAAPGPRPMRLKGREGGPRFELPGELAARLYDHQRDGVRWMWNLQLQGRGGILADDMGLGKTLQVAAFATGLLRSRAAKRVLVLAPTTLLPHWGKEFVVCGLKEGVNLHKYAGGGSKSDRDAALRAVATRGGVLLTTYGMVTHNAASLGEPESEEAAEKVAAASGRGSAVSGQDMPEDHRGLLWDWIVCDEGHKLKNPNAQLPQKVRRLPSSHRLIITGTPIQNHLAELWALYDMCCPGLLGDEVEFRREYAKKIAAGQSRDATERQRSAGARASVELRRVCGPFMLRREKAAVLAKGAADKAAAEKDKETGTAVGSEASEANVAGSSSSKSPAPRSSADPSSGGWAGVKHAPTQLGTKNDLIVWLPLMPAQRRLYRAFLKSGPVRAALNKTGSALSAINVLKKICDHPALCLPLAQTTAAAAATAPFAASASSDSPSKALPAEEADPEEDEEDKSTAKREAIAAAVAAAGLTESDLEGAPDASGKAGFLMGLLRHLADNGHRTLVFSQSRCMLDVLERAARADGHELVRIDGQVPPEERHARVERFQSDPNIPLALLTSQVGGLGLTLTAADRVVIYDPAWNPAADSQSVDRAYRIGQTRDVVVYRLVTCGTVEEKVYRRQVFKGGLSRAGTQDGNHFRYFSAEDTSQLFEVTDEGLARSTTQMELERLHAGERKWTRELAEVEAPLLDRLGAAGVSDHDLLFSKEDSTKAGEGATMLSGGGGGGGGGGKGAGGKASAASGKSSKGGWKGVDSGWGGDAQLGILAAAAGAAVAAPPSSFASAAKSPNPISALGAAATTRSKAIEKLEKLKSQRDKQEVLLDMPQMLKKLPDKGKSIVTRIDALNQEIATLEAEVYAKHGVGTKPTTPKPAASSAASAASAATAASAVTPTKRPETSPVAPPLTVESIASDSPSVAGTVEESPGESIAGTVESESPAPFAATPSAALTTLAVSGAPSTSFARTVSGSSTESGDGFQTAPSSPAGDTGVGMDRLAEMMGGMGVGTGE